MVDLCQNGWPVIDDAKGVGSYVVPGTKGKVTARPGDTSVILLDWLGFWHAEIEPLVWPGVWGWAVRLVRGGTDASNHSGGDAVDGNAPKHPLGTAPSANFTAKQIARIQKRLAALRKVTVVEVLRWGGNYTGRKDGMHVDALGTAALRKKLADAIRSGTLPDGELSYLVGNAKGWRADVYDFLIAGSIRAAFDRLGVGVLGQPKGPEVSTGDKVGRWQEFANGAIFWHPTLTRGIGLVVLGDIYKRWCTGGRETGELGWPVTSEMATPDGKGRYNHFQNGSIYWYPGINDHTVKGAIKAAWAAQGWETGKLGYPTSDESVGEGGIVQTFQGGSILWKDLKATVRPK